jgi:uridine kinase
MGSDYLPLLLIAGIPGSGKTTVAAHLDHAVVISADDFYLDADDPRLPNHDGRPDWEALTALDVDALQSSLTELLKGRRVTIPCYDMSSSSAVGKKLIDPEGACAIVVEGVHVFDLQLGVPAKISRVLIVSSRWKILLRRLKRDIREGRYSRYAALLNVIPLFFRYKNYNERQSKKADYVVQYSGQPAVVAERIKELTNYWAKT